MPVPQGKYYSQCEIQVRESKDMRSNPDAVAYKSEDTGQKTQTSHPYNGVTDSNI